MSDRHAPVILARIWRVQLVVMIGCLEGTATPALCRPAKTHVIFTAVLPWGSSAARVASRSNLEGLPERQAIVRRMQSPTREILSCLDLGTMVSEDLCSEGGHSSGRLSEASQLQWR